MKIAIYSDVFLPSVNGVVTVVKTTAMGLGERGHEVMIFYPKPGSHPIHWQATNVTLRGVPSMPALVYPDIWVAAPTPQSLLALKRFAPDVIHVMDPATVGIEGLLAGKLLKIPVVSSFHTYFMEPEWMKIVNLSRFNKVTDALWRYTIEFYNRCEIVAVHSQYMARDMTEHGLKPQKIRMLANALDLRTIKKVDQKNIKTFRQKYKLGTEVVMYVGRLSKEKNIEVLIQAFSRLVKKITTAQLLIIGDGPIREELENLVLEKGLQHQVIFAGSIPHDVLLQSGAFQSVSLFCTPSTTETQCMSVLEAMAAGLPIVGVKAMGMMDLVTDNGILVTPGNSVELSDALRTLLKDDKRKNTYSRMSMKQAKEHSIDAVMEQHETLYRQVVKEYAARS